MKNQWVKAGIAVASALASPFITWRLWHWYCVQVAGVAKELGWDLGGPQVFFSVTAILAVLIISLLLIIKPEM